MRSAAIFCTLVLVSLPGCHDSATGESGTSGGTSDGGQECACIPETIEPGQFGPPDPPTCGAALCDPLVGHEGNSGGLVLEEPTSLDCALLKLRDRVPGLLTWEINPNESFTDLGYVLIRGDGNAVLRSYGARDLDYHVSDAQYGPLKPSDFFIDCLALPVDDIARMDCLRMALDSVTTVCDPGWDASWSG